MVEVSKNEAVVQELVPLATIAVEVGESVEWVANQFRGHIQLDPVGMRGVPPVAAMEFFARRYEDRKRRAAEDARRTEEAARKRRPRVAAAPAIEGASPVESMMRAEAEAGTFTTPSQDFGGREPPTFLADMIDQGRREADAQRRQTADKKKAAADALKDSLGGRP